MTEIDNLQTMEDVDAWCQEALSQALIHESDQTLRTSFAASLGELVIRVELGVDLSEDRLPNQ